MTKRQAHYWAKYLIKAFPNSPIASGYNAGQWWVIFGVDFLGSPERVREYEQSLRDAEHTLKG